MTRLPASLGLKPRASPAEYRPISSSPTVRPNASCAWTIAFSSTRCACTVAAANVATRPSLILRITCPLLQGALCLRQPSLRHPPGRGSSGCDSRAPFCDDARVRKTPAASGCWSSCCRLHQQPCTSCAIVARLRAGGRRSTPSRAPRRQARALHGRRADCALLQPDRSTHGRLRAKRFATRLPAATSSGPTWRPRWRVYVARRAPTDVTAIEACCVQHVRGVRACSPARDATR